MKKYFSLFLTFGITCLASAQTPPKWDSTYRPAIYDTKVDQFLTYPDSKTDVVFLGNSITDGTDWNELLALPQARNRGISGDITFGVLQRLDEVITGQPAKVFILIGINDISRNIPDSVILGNYRKMIHRIKKGSPGTRIFFNSIMPVNNEFKDRAHFNKDEHILFINAGLKQLCADEKATFINVYDAFLGPDKKLEKSLTYDGLHLTAAGYARWASLIKPHLK